MNALEIHGLTKRRGDFVLRGLELTLPAGCIMGLIGENGAGKSTTIRLILNGLRRDGGTIAVYGKDNRAMTALDREDIGVVLDEVGLPEYMNAQQIGRMMAGIFTHWQPEAYAGYLRRLALPEDKPFRDFSRGMKMKQGLAVALSHQPKLLLLDEATSGLDPVVRDEILTIFADFTRDEEHAVLLSSHIVSDLEKICDYIAFLHKGRLLLCEEKDRLTEAYGILRGGVQVDGITVLTLAVTAVLMAALTLFIDKTKLGKAMRAVSEDKDAATLMGISVDRTITLTFAIGSALAAFASMFYGMTYVYIKPTTGAMPGIKAFTAAVFGGIGSIPGAMLGGILLGLIEQMSKTYISTLWADAIVFAVLVVVLVVKPTGLLGKPMQEKV